MENKSRVYQSSGRIYLLLAILIFGAANAVTRKLTQIGAENLVDGRNPISFCNVLFVGNLCALALLFIIYFRQLKISLLRQINFKQWLTLIAVAVLDAAVVPTLIFSALSFTAVTNVVLLAQIETPVGLFLSIWLLKERVNVWIISGAIIAFIGVVLTVILQKPEANMVSMIGFSLGIGELLTLIAAVVKAVSNLISKVSLEQIPLGIFSVFRMVVGTIVFFFATITIYGSEHFSDVTSGFLWKWMLIYAAVIVVGGQLLWFNGLKRSKAREISLATAFNPIAGILAAYLILGETPSLAQYIGGTVILGGIALNQIGLRRLSVTEQKQLATKKEMSEDILYKGI